MDAILIDVYLHIIYICVTTCIHIGDYRCIYHTSACYLSKNRMLISQPGRSGLSDASARLRFFLGVLGIREFSLLRVVRCEGEQTCDDPPKISCLQLSCFGLACPKSAVRNLTCHKADSTSTDSKASGAAPTSALDGSCTEEVLFAQRY